MQAYLDCRRHKRHTASALEFERYAEHNLVALHDELIEGRYRPGPSICFVVTHPRPREVWAAQFRDRIVHHLLYNRVGPRIEASFIADSCACIAGRGTLYAARRLEAKVRSQTRNWSQPGHYLKIDIANFFGSIDRFVLRDLLRARIADPWWLELAELVLMHDPRPDAILQSTPTRMALIPPHKSLLRQPPHRGLPIGNLSSQFFANIYLDVLDQHVKHRIRARHYIRYVDDMVLLHESPQWLNAARAEIERVLAERLRLELNPRKTILQPIERGIDFVGHLIKPWRRITRRRTVETAHRRISEAAQDERAVRANSYLGLLGQAGSSHTDRVALCRQLLKLGHSVDTTFSRIVGSRTRGRNSHEMPPLHSR